MMTDEYCPWCGDECGSMYCAIKVKEAYKQRIREALEEATPTENPYDPHYVAGGMDAIELVKDILGLEDDDGL